MATTCYGARSGPCGSIRRYCHPTMHVRVNAGQFISARWVNAGQLLGTATLPCPFRSVRTNTSIVPPCPLGSARANTSVLPPYHARPGPCGPIIGTATLPCPFRFMRANYSVLSPYHTVPVRVNAGQLIGTATLPSAFGSMRANYAVLLPYHARSGQCGPIRQCYTLLYPTVDIARSVTRIIPLRAIRIYAFSSPHPPTHPL